MGEQIERYSPFSERAILEDDSIRRVVTEILGWDALPAVMDPGATATIIPLLKGLLAAANAGASDATLAAILTILVDVWDGAGNRLRTYAEQSGTWTVQQGTPPWSVSQSGAWSVSATQSGAWTTGRTWTLASGTDSVAATQSGPWSVAATQSGIWTTGRTWSLSSGSDSVSAAQSGTWTTGRTWNLTSGSDAVSTVQSGTWTVQQGGAPWTQDLTKVGGTAVPTIASVPAAPVARHIDYAARTLRRFSGSLNSSTLAATVVNISVEGAAAAATYTVTTGKVLRIPTLVIFLDATAAATAVGALVEMQIGSSGAWVMIGGAGTGDVTKGPYGHLSIGMTEALVIPAGTAISFRRTLTASQSNTLYISSPDAYEIAS